MRGHAQLVDKAGYVYNRHRTNGDGTVGWCCRAKKKGCKARILTNGIYILRHNNEQHMHDTPMRLYS